MKLQGKVAIVTGSTSGIGQGIAKALAQQGSDIVLNGFGEPDKIEQERRFLSDKYNVTALYHPADMGKPDEIADLISITKKEFGKIDILVNNAGVQYVAPITEMPPEKWDQIIAIDLSSAFHMIHHGLPHLRENGWGRIINIASAHGLVASPFKAPYVAAKHGLLGLTKVVALEAARDNVTCNAICPGYVRTPLVEGQIKGQAKARNISEEDVIQNIILGAQPTKKFIEIEEVGALTVFLCGDHAQGMNGQIISIDGGWTAQ
ncbi:3-hydroxybutyrate dehydrogenase [Candidatus Bealeia paramacronuclearis]|uniref:3-hydroxybutyrate dehydrogenase n=1 Tax=Candidatus Bealeia paramacronuclearis TaxID=1921001 RepID=A0ABZ2C2X5_9PROT|nr:3-hydroxybutyrate dehydrogenase [Candidatus Bealeia paramacronuclearis]